MLKLLEFKVLTVYLNNKKNATMNIIVNINTCSITQDINRMVIFPVMQKFDICFVINFFSLTPTLF